VPDSALPLLRERFLRLFEGEYETGIKPDEVNWVPGRDSEDRTRQICNGWRADNVVAAQVLSEPDGAADRAARPLPTASACSRTTSSGSRRGRRRSLPPDGSYADYLVPAEMITCWISLDDLPADAGPIEVRARLPPVAAHPAAAEPVPCARGLAGSRPGGGARRRRARVVPVAVKAGGGSFHPRPDVARLTSERECSRRAHGARLAHASGRGALPRAERRPDLLALPPPRRPGARRIVLPGAVGRVRLTERRGSPSCRRCNRGPNPGARHSVFLGLYSRWPMAAHRPNGHGWRAKTPVQARQSTVAGGRETGGPRLARVFRPNEPRWDAAAN